jgi:hypothetical protein
VEAKGDGVNRLQRHLQSVVRNKENGGNYSWRGDGSGRVEAKAKNDVARPVVCDVSKAAEGPINGESNAPVEDLTVFGVFGEDDEKLCRRVIRSC